MGNIQRARVPFPLLVLGLLGLVGLVAPAASCNRSGPLPVDDPSGDGGGGDSGGNPRTCLTPLALTSGGKIDLLFMVDNSNSMDAMSTELRNRFGQFFKPFADLAAQGIYADLHIGVVTSDYGAGKSGAPGCTMSPGGQLGKLQAAGVAARRDCQKPLGANFIQYAFTADGKGAHNLPPAQDLLTTFSCMASVGSNGCGFEHQLESVYAALHNPPMENRGFVRDDALLAVVFLTNEDDASAPPDTDVFDKTLTMQYGYLDSYSRQTRFAIVCGNPPMQPPYGDSGGPLNNCVSAPNIGGAGPGKQYDISRYIDFFNQPITNGGAKANPNDVLLAAIDAPEAPFQVILSDPGTPAGREYRTCQMVNEASSPPCVPVLQHSCMNPTQPAFFGDPAVRLNTVVNSVGNHYIASICDSDYSPALVSLAGRIGKILGGAGCINLPLADPANPSCTINDRTPAANGTSNTVAIPQCGAGVPLPCWSIGSKPQCQGLALTVSRAAPPATGTVTTGSCVAAPGSCH